MTRGRERALSVSQRERPGIDPSPTACELLGGLDGKESACSGGDPGSVPESGRSPGEGNGRSLQYSYLGDSMGREAWKVTVRAVAESDRTE